MGWKGAGNREVSRLALLDGRGDPSGAAVEANLEDGARGGTWFPRGSEPKASDA
jgi:hypothetical protein